MKFYTKSLAYIMALAPLYSFAANQPDAASKPTMYQYSTDSLIHLPNLAALGQESAGTLGSGYSNDKGQPVSNCLNLGQTTYAGSGEGLVDIAKNYSLNEVKRQLNLSADANATFGFFSGDVSADFARMLESDDYSESFIYRSKIQLKSSVYNPPESGSILSRLGQIWQNDPNTFRKVCGDQYIQQIGWGGSLYIAVQMNFASRSDKETFDEKMGADFGDVFSMSEKLSSSVQNINKKGTISITALQVGGDPTKLGEILGGQGGVAPIVTCTFDDMKACQAMLNNVITYATSNSGTNFPTQIVIGSPTTPVSAAQLSLDTEDYTSAGVTVPKGDSELTPDIIAARNQLETVVDQMTDYMNRAKTLISQATDPNYRAQLQALSDNASYNIGLALNAGNTCFTNLSQCLSAAQQANANQKPIDTKLLDEPEVNKEISFTMTSYQNQDAMYDVDLVHGTIKQSASSSAQTNIIGHGFSSLLPDGIPCNNTSVVIEDSGNSKHGNNIVAQAPSCSNGYVLTVRVPQSIYYYKFHTYYPITTTVKLLVKHYDS